MSKNHITRFPPEPSGHLHLGHAKALLTNEHYAKGGNGNVIFRFDDTNPIKDYEQYEQSIIDDVNVLNVKYEKITYTSDYFDELLNYAKELIANNKAYCDNIDKKTMSHQRMHGIESKCRHNSIEQNMQIFNKMILGELTDYCLRAKIDMAIPNKALRDPVLYRYIDVEHPKTKNKYKIYPTYDFSCPIVDSIEGITLMLRTTEYQDRNDQYKWILKQLNLRKPQMNTYSRINIRYNVMSKRKLKWFVDNSIVDGWNDPRMPTIKGLMRRGLLVESIRKLFDSEGYKSKSVNNMSSDKLWAINRKIIESQCPRYVCLFGELYNVSVSNFADIYDEKQFNKSVPKYKKKLNLGNKTIEYSDNLYMEANDCVDLKENDEVTLMNWGNIIIENIDHNAKTLTIALNLDGDVRRTNKKLTWLSNNNNTTAKINLYDNLLIKEILGEDDDFKDYINKDTRNVIDITMSNDVKDNIKKGDIIQFLRKGQFICDNYTENNIDFIEIPKGRK